MKSLLEKLVSFESITPHDNGCQEYMITFLERLGFECVRYNNSPVSNFFARFGTGMPLVVFAGHTDVVPVGELSRWHTSPFVLHEQEDLYIGRGVADMKGSLASMLRMAEQFVHNHPNTQGSLGFLITSGEEGDDFDLGTPYVMKKLVEQGICPTYCIVGEPSSTKQTGDVVKIGRRGSLTATVRLEGKQGHVAYPHLAENPIHRISPVLTELVTTQWDQGNQYFPPTSMQMTHIQSGGQANNIIPGELTLNFNFRFSTEQTFEKLKDRVHACFKKYELTPSIEWKLNGEPFLTSPGLLVECCLRAIKEVTNQTPELSTSGGTSDARFIAPYGVEVIELGPLNATIHQVNESVGKADLEILTAIYYSISKQILVDR